MVREAKEKREKRGEGETGLKDTKQKRRLQRAAGAPGIQSQMGTRDRREENSSEGGHRTNFYSRITFKKKGAWGRMGRFLQAGAV